MSWHNRLTHILSRLALVIPLSLGSMAYAEYIPSQPLPLALSSSALSSSQRLDHITSQELSKNNLPTKNLLPNLNIYATGGTIAGTSVSNTDTSQYAPEKLGVDRLIDGVPELQTIANVHGIQIANVGSISINNDILLTLSKRLNHDLSGGSSDNLSSDIDGAVITHGTDTLEETAFFLSLTARLEKPIVMVGAMRPSTVLSADGYLNLLQAASVAVDDTSKNRGVMVVMNDRISSGYYVTKTHANTPDTFRAPESGEYGQMIGLTPHYFYQPQKVTNQSFFDVSSIDHLPKIAIIYGYQSVDASLLDAAIANGAQGIVIAGPGAGILSTPLLTRIEALSAQGFPVVRSTHVQSGYVKTQSVGGIGSGFLNSKKSRILLSLALANGDDMQTIRNRFK